MAERAVRLWPDPVLVQSCEIVDLGDPTLPALIDDLFDTMYVANGRGLAAPQIGILKRVFVVDVSWKDGARDPRVFINPNVVSSAGRETMEEQCLSIPNLPMPVCRADKIQLRWSNREDVRQTAPFDGALARCILHELDHLDGTVILDHQTPENRARLEAAYAP